MLLKSYTVIATSVLTLAAAAAAPPQEQKSVKLDFTILRGNSISDAGKNKRAKLVKRADYESLELTNQQSYYQVDLSIGSKGDKCQVLIDTGSSDLWVMGSDIKCQASSISARGLQENSHRRVLSAEDLEFVGKLENKDNQKGETVTLTYGSPIPTEYASLLAGYGTEYESQLGSGGYNTLGGSGYSAPASACTALGSFNTAGSDSFKLNSSAPDFAISYADGTYAHGVWGQDSINFKDFNVSDASFAVVNETSSTFGVLGIGLENLETTYFSSTSGDAYTYENFPVRLKTSGAIKKNLYSLYLAESDSDKGTILFGAVDHAKYSGQLTTVPLVNIHPSTLKKPIRFDIALDSISLQSNSQNVSISTSRIAALLDSGTTITYLPTSILNSLVSSLDGMSSSTGFYEVDCAYNTDSAYAVFNFSGVEIKVPFSDLILPYGSSTCYLGVLEQTSDSSTSYPYAVLGDNFIRNAYVVYDLEDYEISLAQAKYTTDEDIETVSSSVPSAVKAAQYSSTGLATSADGSSSTELVSSGLKKSAGERTAIIPKPLLVVMIALGATAALI